MQAGPFRRLAVAVSLSPRREALLAEAGRLAEQLGAHLTVIHVGKRSEHRQAHLEALMERQHLDTPQCELIFPSGSPAEAIAKACQDYQIDLLVLGALPSRTWKEKLWGTIAQQTIRRVGCSILLMADPKKKPMPTREMAVGTCRTDSPTLEERALRMALSLEVKDVHILTKDASAVGTYATRLTRRRKLVGTELEHARQWLDPFEVDDPDSGPHPEVHIKLYQGTKAKAWAEFCRRQHIDLLALEAPQTEKMGPMWRLSIPHLSNLIAELPTNLLLVR